MNQKKFNGQITLSKAILQHLGLFQRSITSPDYAHVASRRNASYEEQWKFYLDSNMYNFLLTDWSIIQFEHTLADSSLKLRYVFIECPYESPLSFFEYKAEAQTNIRTELEDGYESYLEEDCDLKDHPRPIRYDYTPLQYRKGEHPASHFHLGCQNEFRLSTRKLLKPSSFILFLARHIYPKNWIGLLDGTQIKQYERYVRKKLTNIEEVYFHEWDNCEMHLD